MKILFITYRLPYPPFSGERLRTYQLLELLASHYELRLITFVTSDREIENSKYLEDAGIRVECIRLNKISANLRRFFALFAKPRTPVQVSYYSDKRMQTAIAEVVSRERIDLTFTCLARMGQYFLKDTSAVQVLDYMDAFSEYYYSRALISKNLLSEIIDRIESSRLKHWEKKLLGQYNLTTIISSFDALKISSKSPPIVLPGHVDDYLNYCASDIPADELARFPSIVFFGEMSTYYSENAVTFMVKEVLPLVWNVLPDLRFFIVGANPTRNIQVLASERVVITGFVDDVRNYVAYADISVAPLQMGSGLKYKVVQSMAMGVPVVATSIANQGIQAENGKHLLVADTPNDFSAAILSLLSDSSQKQAIINNALEFVTANFSKQSLLLKLERMLDGLKSS